MKLRTLFLSAAFLALTHAASAQDIGSNVNSLEITDFAQTEARSYDDLIGRAVLIEFFAYW
jgi:hypothetical protein